MEIVEEYNIQNLHVQYCYLEEYIQSNLHNKGVVQHW